MSAAEWIVVMMAAGLALLLWTLHSASRQSPGSGFGGAWQPVNTSGPKHRNGRKQEVKRG